MEIKIDCKLLSEQIRLLDIYSSVIVDHHKRELVDGVVNLLDKIAWAVEEDEEIYFQRVYEI